MQNSVVTAEQGGSTEMVEGNPWRNVDRVNTYLCGAGDLGNTHESKITDVWRGETLVWTRYLEQRHH